MERGYQCNYLETVTIQRICLSQLNNVCHSNQGISISGKPGELRKRGLPAFMTIFSNGKLTCRVLIFAPIQQEGNNINYTRIILYQSFGGTTD